MVYPFFTLLSFWLLAVQTCSAAGGNHRPSQASALDHTLPTGHPQKPPFDCGTRQHSHASEHFNATIAALHNGNHHWQGAPGSRDRSPALFPRANVATVNTHFHIVATHANSGLITQTMITNQINAMNSAYSPYGIQFNLASSEQTVNDAWAVDANSTVDTAMKTALRKGTYADLNIYFLTDWAGGNLGVCSLPTTLGSPPVQPSTYATDGCTVNANTMPGGSFQGYNYGGTAIHEGGHWFGLLHTFEGYSCSGTGDYVSDTPQEATSTDGCPTGKNTCSGRPGVDPIHNYMDYSYDTCYQGFTAGQQQRMSQLWTMYRSGN